MPRLTLASLAAAIVILVAPKTAGSAEPLRTVIDGELKAAWEREGVSPAPRSTDSEFLRRVYLDLAGTVPTYEETVAFLADTDPKKREKLIDRLLDDPRFATAQADVWDLTLFGREPPNLSAVQKREGFKAWLAKQFAENVPYNIWVRELMLAEKPGPEMFLVQFRNQPEEATVAITKIFLGTQLQCARCHDHPYDVWTQKDFYGMAGFFVRLVVQEAGSGNKRTFSIGEKRTGEVLFSGSVTEQKPGRKGDPVQPKFLGGKELDEPPVAKDFKEPAPKTGTKLPKPDFSRKAKLADWISSKDNPYLAKAAVNRVWSQFMGRGIVHPVDDFHKENLPSHPKLLKAMTAGLLQKDFDLKWLIREIVNSEVYQLGLIGPNREALPQWFERARVRPLSAEEIMAAMRVVSGYDLANKAGEKLPNAGTEYFLRYFGEPTNGLGDFQGSLHEHLFLNNSGNVRQMISPKKGNLADSLVTSKDSPEKKVERLFLTVLHRKPSAKETSAFVKHLGAKDKAEALVEDCIWVLLNSSEFRFNH